jgi:hypothetical protein
VDRSAGRSIRRCSIENPMDANVILTIATMVISAAGVILGLSIKSAISEVKVEIADNRRNDAQEMKTWVETNFVRKTN